jgi:hypothetical protein
MLLLLLLAACGPATPARPGGNDAVAAVATEFAALYEANGGLLTFGFPITGDLVDAQGRSLQYFQNMLLVATPDEGTIAAAPLGEWALSESDMASEPGVSPDDGFQAFYDAHGGEALFGPALTARVEEAGRWVQYFRNAKLEWHPEEPPALRVQLGALGLAHYWHSGAAIRYQDQTQQQAFIGERPSGPVDVVAAVAAPVLFAGEAQRVAVTVRNGGDAPVAGMRLTGEVLYFDGASEVVAPIVLEATDADGLAQATFALEGAAPGYLVSVRVVAYDLDGTEAGRAETSFKVWW